jgi:large subunit ribosomal protein L25
MKSIGFEGVARQGNGKKLAAQLRREGQIPCNLYGTGKETLFSAKEISFDKLINTPEVYLIDLDIAGKKAQAILKEVQYHPVTDRVIHADFLEVTADKEVQIKVPVKLIGTAAGVREGGKLMAPLRKIKVKAIPANLPDGVEIDIKNLNIGDKIKVAELGERPYKILEPKGSVIVAVKTTRNALKDEEVEGVVAETEEGAEATPEAATAE